MEGVQIGPYHTWRDWGLVLQEIEITSPEKKKRIINVPYRDGVLELPSSFVGDEKYEMRDMKLTFAMVAETYGRMFLLTSEIANAISGKCLEIILDDDRSYYYTGTCYVDTERINPMITSVNIDIEIAPYKQERFSSVGRWEWDLYAFDDGIIREYKDMQVDGTRTLIIPGRRKKVTPIFICTSNMKVSYGGNTYELKAGISKVLNICLGAGEHALTFSGSGTVSVDYRGGCL